MDTRSKAEVEQMVGEIRAHMPETYKAIRARAAEHQGTFELVRRALRGEPNCFYAIERGRVVGTPFSLGDIMSEVAKYMVGFGCAHVCIWPDAGQPAGGKHGAH